MWLWPLRAPHAYRYAISFSCFQWRWWEKWRGCRSAACQQDDHSHNSSKRTERRGGRWWEAGGFGDFRTAILHNQFSLLFSFRVPLHQLTNNELISVPVVYPCEHGRMHMFLCYTIWVKLHFSIHSWLAHIEGNRASFCNGKMMSVSLRMCVYGCGVEGKWGREKVMGGREQISA